MPVRLLALGALVALASVGCGVVPPPNPLCDPELSGDILFIEAQSVPSAEQVPCVGALPVGWKLESFEVRDGSSRFYLDSDRAGVRAVKVELVARCDTSEATEIPSDTPGIAQFEEIDAIGERYGGIRYYVFPGGCVTYSFDFEGEGRTELAREVSLALDFYPRAELEALAGSYGFEL